MTLPFSSAGGKTGGEVAEQTPETLAVGIDSLLADDDRYRYFSANAASISGKISPETFCKKG